jgi:four helix bundle protein
MKPGNVIIDRTFNFALEIISLYKILCDNKEYILSKQLLRSSTSIGANVEEAIAAQSRKDFIHKMSIASKESRETRYWLRLLDKSKLVDIDYSCALLNVEHIINILTKIVKTTVEKADNNSNEKAAII